MYHSSQRCISCANDWSDSIIPEPLDLSGPESSITVMCGPCFKELSPDRIIRAILDELQSSPSWRSMEVMGRSRIIIEIQMMIEGIKRVARDTSLTGAD